MIQYRYGRSIWEIGSRWDIDSDIDMGYGLPIRNMVYRYGHLPYRYGDPGYRYGIWANDMGDDNIDTVISHIDMGYLVTLIENKHPTDIGARLTFRVNAHTDARKRRRRFNVGRVLVLNHPHSNRRSERKRRFREYEKAPGFRPGPCAEAGRRRRKIFDVGRVLALNSHPTALPRGRGLHSSTSQLNLSRV